MTLGLVAETWLGVRRSLSLPFPKIGTPIRQQYGPL